MCMKKNISMILMTVLCASLFIAPMSVSADNNTVIKPFAHYKFDDANHYGKDSSSHGFHLEQASTSGNRNAMQLLSDGKDGYISIRRDQKENGETKGTGAYLYAPKQGNTSYDFSDMVKGSYTFSMKFRSDNTTGFGDVYAISFGPYTQCLTVIPWRNGIEVQLNNIEFAPGSTPEEKIEFCENNKFFVAYSTKNWIDLSIVADADSKESRVYINGQIIYEDNLPGVKLTSSANDDYAFCIGAQCNIYGASAQQFGNVDIKDLVIYDCALSQENIANVIKGKDAVLEKQPSETVYVTAIEEIDATAFDLQITDANPFETILEGGLPSKMKVTLSNGITRSFPVYWYPGNNDTIRGYIQSGYMNPSAFETEMKCGYVAKFDYDEDSVTISEVKLDGQDYVPGTEITPAKHTLSFKLDVTGGATLNSVSYYGMEWEPEDDGTYYVDIAEGGLITIDIDKATYTVTYMDGREKLSTSKYTANGMEPLNEVKKDGYTFVGWYLDEELTEAFTALDYANPTNITLYAKWDSVSNGSPLVVIIASVLGVGVLAGVGVLLIKKSKKRADKEVIQ